MTKIKNTICWADIPVTDLDRALVYFSVDGRLDDAIEQAEKHGGKILQAKHAIGPYGDRGIVLDSEGNRIALHQAH